MVGSAAAAFIAAAICTGCGYHVSGHSDLVPKTVHTIAIPAWSNATIRYRLTDRLPEAIAREFITKTRYRVIPNENEADAVLYGSVVNYMAFPTVFDPAVGRASTVQVTVVMSARLVDRKTGKVIFSRPSFEMKQQYEISSDPRAFVDESDIAMDRLSRDVARGLVSAILEDF